MTLPVSLDQAKAQLRVDSADQDAEIGDFIVDAAVWVEGYTGQILEAHDVDEQFRGTRPVTLRAWPILADAVPTVTYLDNEGQAVTLDARIDVSERPARVMPAVGMFWPWQGKDQTFTVRVRAGYEDPDDVPRNIRRAMLLLIAAYDADREGGAVFQLAEATARRLCQRLKRHTL